jgi:signal transduction histidine kinase
MKVEYYILLFAAFLVIVQGLFVLFRKGVLLKRIFFALVTFFCALWAVGIVLFLSESDVARLIPISQIHYIASAGIAWASLSFVYSLSTIKTTRQVMKISAVLAIPCICIALFIILRPNMLFSSPIISEPNTVSLEIFPYSIFVTYFLSYCLLLIRCLLRNYTKEAKNTLERSRIRYVFIAYILAMIIGAFYNLILPLFGNYELIWIGPMSLIIFASVLYLSIIRHRLFGITLYTVRIILWITATIALSVLYFITISYIYSQYNIFAGTQAYLANTIATLIFVMLFYLVMRFISKSSNKLFGSGLLDEQIINEVTAKTLSTVDMKRMLHGVTDVIARHMNHTYAVVVISGFDGNSGGNGGNAGNSGNGGGHFIAGTTRLPLSHDDYAAVINCAERQPAKVIITEEIDIDDKIYSVLRAKHISVIVRLGIKGEDKDGQAQITHGYLIIGREKQALYSDSEVQVLSSIGNILSVGIKNTEYYQDIQNFNAELKRDIAEATVKLRESNKKLKMLDKTKDDFLSMASHQLRTPLTVIRGYASLALGGKLKTKRALDAGLSEIALAGERMAFLINDLLNVSRLQSGRLEFKFEPVQLADLVESEVNQLALVAEKRNIRIIYTKPADLPPVSIDKDKMNQVIMNFLDNAVYYSNKGGEIEVSLTRSGTGKQLEFKVTDHGIGVPKAEQDKLFTKFFRAGNARAVRSDGTGIGLYMAAKIIKAHRAEIIFTSEEGVGSTFGFRVGL